MTEEGYYTCLVDLPDDNPGGFKPGLELMQMLEGKKPLSMFVDVLPSRRFLYETVFDPHAEAGRLVKASKVEKRGEYEAVIVLYALPDQAWRIDAYWEATKEPYYIDSPDYADRERRIGELLGYSRESTERFIVSSQHQVHRYRAKRKAFQNDGEAAMPPRAEEWQGVSRDENGDEKSVTAILYAPEYDEVGQVWLCYARCPAIDDHIHDCAEGESPEAAYKEGMQFFKWVVWKFDLCDVEKRRFDW